MNIQPNEPEVLVEWANVVMVGDFNPKIFHPMWFAYNGILREAEAKDAHLDIIHPDVARFTMEWLSIQVVRNQFVAEVKADVYLTHLGDLVRNAFKLLSHSPVRQMGINAAFRLHFRSQDDWHAFGHMLLPKSPWAEVLDYPGLRGVHIQGARKDQYRGFVTVAVEPDLSLAGDAIVRINDHFEKPLAIDNEPGEASGARWALEILHSDFDASYRRAKDMVRQIITNFTTTNTFDSGK